MKNTTNYQFKKPDVTDFVLVSDLNENFDKIDAELKKANDAIGTVGQLQTTNKTNLVGAVNELFQNSGNAKRDLSAAITGLNPNAGVNQNSTFQALIDAVNAIEVKTSPFNTTANFVNSDFGQSTHSIAFMYPDGSFIATDDTQSVNVCYVYSANGTLQTTIDKTDESLLFIGISHDGNTLYWRLGWGNTSLTATNKMGIVTNANDVQGGSANAHRLGYVTSNTSRIFIFANGPAAIYNLANRVYVADSWFNQQQTRIYMPLENGVACLSNGTDVIEMCDNDGQQGTFRKHLITLFMNMAF